MRKGDVICPECGAGFHRIELGSRRGTTGEFRCPRLDGGRLSADGRAGEYLRIDAILSRMRKMRLGRQVFAESKIPKSRLPLEWTGPEAGFMLGCMGQTNQTGSCPRCGRRVELVLLKAGEAYGLQCIGCEKFDPLKSELVTGWLNGELGRRKRTIVQPE